MNETIGRGGAREGAGRKPAGYVPPPEKVAYDEARARSELAKAVKLEREHEINTGLHVSRAAVQAACAAAFAATAQTLRSIPDNIERRLGVDPVLAQEIGRLIDEAMDTLSTELTRMGEDGF
jgi:hypothetical protein